LKRILGGLGVSRQRRATHAPHQLGVPPNDEFKRAAVTALGEPAEEFRVGRGIGRTDGDGEGVKDRRLRHRITHKCHGRG
jgi:hypothetical protein